MAKKFNGYVKDNHKSNTGTFYTPQLWVNDAHKTLNHYLGDDWKDEYTVWDCSAGQGQLTRDHEFKNLFLSTLEQDDLKELKKQKAISFNYNFTDYIDSDSDDIFDAKKDEPIPNKLKKSLKKDKMLFLINPPYVLIKDGTKSTVHKAMKQDKLGFPSGQLYAQFLYKIAKYQEINKDITVACFCPPLYMTGSSFNTFRTFWYEHFYYKYGFMFCASEFGLSKLWGVSFILWMPKCY